MSRPLPRLLPSLRGLLDPPPRAAADTGSLGRWGERAAARHLQAKGYKVLSRNHATPIGEADLICLAPDRRTHVLVEVKTRRAERDGGGERGPEAAITARKARKLRRLVEAIAKSTGRTEAAWRIDVIAVRATAGGNDIAHYERAVTG